MQSVDPNVIGVAIIVLVSVLFGYSLQYIGRAWSQWLVLHRSRAVDKLQRNRQGVSLPQATQPGGQVTAKHPAVQQQQSAQGTP